MVLLPPRLTESYPSLCHSTMATNMIVMRTADPTFRTTVKTQRGFFLLVLVFHELRALAFALAEVRALSVHAAAAALASAGFATC